MHFKYNNTTYNFTRYPATTNRSLRAWSAADEYLLKFLDELDLNDLKIVIANDRFGFLLCCLQTYRPGCVLNYKSQEKAWQQNLSANKQELEPGQVILPLDKTAGQFDLALVKVPKSLGLFQMYLYQLSQNLGSEASVICAFMTRHFSPQYLTIASEFFEVVEQSKAWKKSRLMVLKHKKPLPEIKLLKSIHFGNGKLLLQYPGVFSAEKIDRGTLFLLEHLSLRETDNCILDLAAGSGVLAMETRARKEDAEIHLLDDAFLAVESSRLNLAPEHTHFHFADNLEAFDPGYFDFVVSNPPFHFEFENNIEVALRLFREVHRCLKKDGHFQLVANKHLNYKTHLAKIYQRVNIVGENEKFVVYDCFPA